MKKVIIFLFVLIIISISAFSGCDSGEKPNPVVTNVNGYWSNGYYWVQVSYHNNGGTGDVKAWAEVSQGGQTYTHFGLQTAHEGTDTMETMRFTEVSPLGGSISYRGWVTVG